MRIISVIAVVLSLGLTACGNPSYKHITVYNTRTNDTIYEYEGKAGVMEGDEWLYITTYDDGREATDRLRLNSNIAYIVREGGEK